MTGAGAALRAMSAALTGLAIAITINAALLSKNPFIENLPPLERIRQRCSTRAAIHGVALGQQLTAIDVSDLSWNHICLCWFYAAISNAVTKKRAQPTD